MNTPGKGFAGGGAKGRPIVMLAVLLSVWMGSRIVMWESPFPLAEAAEEISSQLLASQSSEKPRETFAPAARATGTVEEAKSQDTARLWNGTHPSLAAPALAAPLVWEDQAAPELRSDIETGASHQLVWMAAMAHLPMPSAIQQRLAEPVRPAGASTAAQAQADRWSLDGWAFWREGSNRSLVSAGRAPTYGASQAGAVLNYRLAPADARDPRAYARLYRALIDGGESEAAAGISARPFARLPLRAHAELRVTEYASATEIRPAAFVTTELPPIAMPLGLTTEAYAQAGYVAGEGSTAFADGQLHILREVSRFDLATISVGAAAWGGAQDNAQRLDIGPSVRADLRIGAVPARVSLDYRERVAGDAEPPSGVAVTLSTRF